jgi:hypothetical protein
MPKLQSFPVPTWVRVAVCLAACSPVVFVGLAVYLGRPVPLTASSVATIVTLNVLWLAFRRQE